MSQFIFETVPKLVCGPGSAAQLGALAQGLGMGHAFVVTDAGLVRAGLLAGVEAALAAAGVAVTLYSAVQADPPETVVEAAVYAARSAGADGVIGFGGGSSLDTAKLVALLIGTPQALPAIYGIGLAQGPRRPLIQVPTTAGTGSEATPIAIVTTPTHEKKGVVSSLLYPDIAVLDGDLTLGLPPAVTAMTGIDAMVHAIEAFTSRHKKNPLSDMLALKGLALLAGNIRSAVSDGGNQAARQAMLLGALFAGMAFANAPVAAVHALAYPLGGHFHVPHGHANALMLAPVLRFNAAAAQSAYAELARLILPGPSFADDQAATTAFVEAMAELVAEMPFAQTLRAVGVGADDLPMLARDAMNVQRLLINNPRAVTEEDALALYQAVY